MTDEFHELEAGRLAGKVRRLNRELALCIAQCKDLGTQVNAARHALQKVQTVTRDDDNWASMAQEVYNICEEGLK